MNDEKLPEELKEACLWLLGDNLKEIDRFCVEEKIESPALFASFVSEYALTLVSAVVSLISTTSESDAVAIDIVENLKHRISNIETFEKNSN